jgi:2-oxoglutarate ferredoxin oxidoreductase subunit gamma
MSTDKIIVAGAGGQGALRIGQMLAYAALESGLEVEWIPSYGAEMRGGTANCHVVISDEEIPYSMITEPDCLLVMNELSLTKFGSDVKAGGILIINCSIIEGEYDRKELNIFYVPADKIAEEEGNPKGTNMVMLGAYLAASSKVTLESIEKLIEKTFTGSKAKYVDSNKRLVRRGFDYIKPLANGKTQ